MLQCLYALLMVGGKEGVTQRVMQGKQTSLWCPMVEDEAVTQSGSACKYPVRTDFLPLLCQRLGVQV